MSTMNITIIIPALQLPPAGGGGRKDSGSPQPTTPFPPINISPSPTPTLSISNKGSCTPMSMRSTTPATAMILSQQDTTVITTRTTMSSRTEEQHNCHHHYDHYHDEQKHGTAFLSRENSMNDESFEDYYEDDTFLLPLTSASETPPAELPLQSAPPPELPNDNSTDAADIDSSMATLMHHEEVSAGNNNNNSEFARTDDETTEDEENFDTALVEEGTIIVESSLNSSSSAGETSNSELVGLSTNSRHSANSDTVSVDSRPTESNSSPETVIHVFKSSNPESENEANDLINQSPSTTSCCSPQKSYHDTPSLSAKQTLVRQVSMHGYEKTSNQEEAEVIQYTEEEETAVDTQIQISEDVAVNQVPTIQSPDASTQTVDEIPKSMTPDASTQTADETPKSMTPNVSTQTEEQVPNGKSSEGTKPKLHKQNATSRHASTQSVDEGRVRSSHAELRSKSLSTTDELNEISQQVTQAVTEDHSKSSQRTIQTVTEEVKSSESTTQTLNEEPEQTLRAAKTQTIESQSTIPEESTTEAAEDESSESAKESSSNAHSIEVTEEKSPEPPQEPQEVSEIIEEKELELFSSEPPPNLQQRAPLQPPTIITTPASAKGERTDSQVDTSQTSQEQQECQELHTEQEYSQEEFENDVTRPSEGEQTDADKYETVDESETNMQTADDSEALHREFPEIVPSPKPKKRLKSVRKTKGKVFPNPRKPSNYPQRMNKVTLARQALAREKRRVYVEERIQNYIKNAQANNIPLPTTLPLTTGALASSIAEMSTVHHQEQQQQRKSIDKSEITTTIKNTTTIATTTTVKHKVETPTPTVNELQNQILHSKSAPLHPIPVAVDANNYYLNHPISLPPPPQNLSAIQVARVHNHHHHRRTPFKPPPSVASLHSNNNNNSFSLPMVKAMPATTTTIAPDISFQQLQQQQQQEDGSESVKQTIFAIPAGNHSNAIEAITSQKTWKGVEHHGYFYSFRVRQSGPVQMMDKGVQTGSSAAATASPQSHSYTLSFSETRSTNSSFIVSNHPLPAPADSSAKITASSSQHFMINQSEAVPSSTITSGPENIDDRDKILREITETVQLRHDAELRRAELVQRANDLQMRVKEKRDKINRRHEFWHKKYIEESALTRPLEASCSSLRAELNTVHRRLLAHLEGRDLPLRLRDGPSKKANYKIMAARLQHEIKELQQKVKAAKLKLESEIKLKEQADREVREIRNDLAHKKVVMSLARSQVSTLPAVHPRVYDPLIY